MRRVLLAVAATVAVLVMLLGFKTTPASTAARPGAVVSQTPGGSSSTDGGSTSSSTIAGQTVQTRYGPVQVQVTFVDGRVTDVQALQLPGNDPRSSEISGYAEPVLAREAVQAQSAEIDVVSGATFTSEAYAQSLQSAIDQARG